MNSEAIKHAKELVRQIESAITHEQHLQEIIAQLVRDRNHLLRLIREHNKHVRKYSPSSPEYQPIDLATDNNEPEAHCRICDKPMNMTAWETQICGHHL